MTDKNMALWDQAYKLNLKAIKLVEKPYKHSTINGYYIIELATKIWGPIGSKWGYIILKDEMITGGIMLNDKGADWGNEITNTVQIELFYPEGKITQYGHTPYVYKSKWGPITDHEASKKSLTDALKKSLSMLGFGGEVWKGEMEDFNYLAARQAEQAISNADNKDDEIESQINQLRYDLEKAHENIKALDKKPALKAYFDKTVIQFNRKSAIPHLKEKVQIAIKSLTLATEKRAEELNNEQ